MTGPGVTHQPLGTAGDERTWYMYIQLYSHTNTNTQLMGIRVLCGYWQILGMLRGVILRHTQYSSVLGEVKLLCVFFRLGAFTQEASVTNRVVYTLMRSEPVQNPPVPSPPLLTGCTISRIYMIS